MELKTTSLTTDIAKAFSDVSTATGDSTVDGKITDLQGKLASKIATAIETYLKSGTITLNFTSATLTSPSGSTLTVTGSTSGTIS